MLVYMASVTRILLVLKKKPQGFWQEWKENPLWPHKDQGLNQNYSFGNLKTHLKNIRQDVVNICLQHIRQDVVN